MDTDLDSACKIYEKNIYTEFDKKKLTLLFLKKWNQFEYPKSTGLKYARYIRSDPIRSFRFVINQTEKILSSQFQLCYKMITAKATANAKQISTIVKRFPYRNKNLKAMHTLVTYQLIM
jgi:hypothetical protein